MTDYTWPETYKARDERWFIHTNEAEFTSPLTGLAHYTARAGERIDFALVFPPLTRAEADDLWGWFLQLRGKVNRILYTPQSYLLSPRGGLAGSTRRVNADARATSITLATSAANNGAFLRGEWISVINSLGRPELKRVTADVDQGDTKIPVFPEVHHELPSAARLMAKPQGRYILMTPPELLYSPSPLVNGLSCRLKESLT